MLKHAIEGLDSVINKNPWVPQLAGILPLSALIDFLDIPPKLHVFELTGTAPLWSWPVTPAGSRLLLHEDRHPLQSCYLDRYGSSVSLKGTDGRYGDHYLLASPETLRLCLRACRMQTIENAHENMNEDRKRTQNLQFIYVSRIPNAKDRTISSSWLRYSLLDSLRMQSPRYLATSFLGWGLWTSMMIMSGILQTWVALAFLTLIPVTGSVVFVMYGGSPRILLNERPSKYNRLVLVSEHENSTDWMAFYGESSIVNSLLNRQLDRKGPVRSRSFHFFPRVLLRFLILGQWAMAVAAAAKQDWNAYFISFWIAFCIFTHAYILTAPRAARDWLNYTANVDLQRFQTQLSSRRALLNTIAALNPDTLTSGDPTSFSEGGMKWIDPILKPGQDRSKWEEATLAAMSGSSFDSSDVDLCSEKYKSIDNNFLSMEWNELYQPYYWKRFIQEGIYVAAKIKKDRTFPREVVPIEGDRAV